MPALLACLLLLVSVRAYAQTETVYADRLSVGSGVPGTAPASGTVRLQGLATAGGDQVLLIDSSTLAVMRRVLGKADLPSAIAYEDEANTFASNQTFSGDIAVNGGDVTSTGGLAIRPTGNLVLDPTGNVIIGADGLNVIPATGYAYNLGAPTVKFLALHAAELRVESLVAADVRSTIGGKLLVAPTTELTAALAAAGTTISVKHNEIANGDRLWLEAGGDVEFLAVTSGANGSGPYTYTVTRNLDGSGANDWPAGSAVVNTGTTGDGLIEQYADSGLGGLIGPTIRGLVRTSSTYNALSDRWAIGNLDGLYGYSGATYGAAFGNPAAANLTIDPGAGIRLRDGSTTTLQMTANALDLLNTGVVKSGSASAFGTGTGIWLAANSGTPQVRIGNPAGRHLAWDGTSLGLVSDGLAINESGVAMGMASGSFSAARSVYWGAAVAGSGSGGRIWDSGTTNRGFLIQRDDQAGAGQRIEVAVGGSTLPFASLTVADSGLVVGGQSSLGVYQPFRPSVNNGHSLGTASFKWAEIYWAEPTTTTALFPLVTDSGRIMAKSDGTNGSFTIGGTCTLTFEFGILTGRSGAGCP